MMYLILLLTQLIFVLSASGSYTTHYLEDGCLDGLTKTLWLDSSGPQSSVIIKVSRKPGFRNDMDCSLIIKPSFSNTNHNYISKTAVALVVDILNLRTKEFNLCKDVFKVSVQDYDDWDTVLYGCWSNLTGKYVSSIGSPLNNAIKIEFKTSRFGPPAPSEYKLELTATMQTETHDAECPKSSQESFKCSTNNRCIWKGLTCDHRNNCGDDSDEWKHEGAKCDGSNKHTLVIGIPVGLAVFVVVIVVVCCVCRKDKKHREDIPVATAPLLTAIETGENDMSSGKSRMSRTAYGSTEQREEPPPYDYEPPFPPPPTYKE